MKQIQKMAKSNQSLDSNNTLNKNSNFIYKKKIDENLIPTKENDNYDKNEIDNKFNIFEEDDDNEENQKYSYECSNIMLLVNNIHQGNDECHFQIILRNNGKQSWPEGAQLIYERNSSFVGENIMLKPQKPGESYNYSVIVKDFRQKPVGEYKANLLFYVGGER